MFLLRRDWSTIRACHSRVRTKQAGLLSSHGAKSVPIRAIQICVHRPALNWLVIKIPGQPLRLNSARLYTTTLPDFTPTTLVVRYLYLLHWQVCTPYFSFRAQHDTYTCQQCSKRSLGRYRHPRHLPTFLKTVLDYCAVT